MDEIKKQLAVARDLLENFIRDDANIRQVKLAGELLVESLKNGHKIISCGNGGSMSDAMHFAEEMSGRFREDRKPFPAVAISDPAHISCVANDYGYEYIFSRYIEAFGKKGDSLLAISTSGKSKNVLKAIDIAREKEMHIIGLTGKDGGKM